MILGLLALLLALCVSTPAFAQIPLDTWIAIRNPTNLTGATLTGALYEKHVSVAYSPKTKRLYFNGGDTHKHFVGPGGVDFGSASYYQGTHSLDLGNRLANPGNPNAGWALEHAYCSSGTEVQPKRPDFVGFTWVPWLDRFMLVPGEFESGTSANCPGETPAFGDDPNYAFRKLMTLDTTSRQWAILPAPHGALYTGNDYPWHVVADPATQQVVRLEYSGDLVADHFSTATNAWTYYRPGGNGLNCAKSHLAMIGRTVYCADRERGNLGAYDLDAHTARVVGPLPGSTLPGGSVPADKGYLFAVSQALVYAELDGATWGGTFAYRIWTWSAAAPTWSRIDTLPWQTLDGSPLPAGEMPRGTSGAVDTDTGTLYLTGQYGGTASYSWALRLSGAAPPAPSLAWVQYPNSALRPAMGPNPPNNPVHILDYSGGWFDAKRGEYGVWGGGHADYPGNEVCTFTPITIWTCGPRSPWVDDPTTETTADGNPTSRHTSSCIARVDLPGWDGFFCHGGSLWREGWPTRAAWFYHRDTRTWERLPDIPLLGESDYGATSLYTYAVFDAARGQVLVRTRNKCMSYTVATKVWAKQADCPFSEFDLSAAFDPERRIFVTLGVGRLEAWNTATFPWTPIALAPAGDATPLIAKAPGFVFDPVGTRYLAYAGGRDVYALDRDTWTFTKLAVAGADPGPAYPVGTHNRLQYVPGTHGLLVMNSIDGGVFYLQLAGGAPPVPVPPAAPSGLVAPSVLSWADNASDETYQEVYRKAEACAGPLPLAFLAQVPANATTYTDAAVSPSTTYCYQVRAGNAAGPSGWSNTAERVVPAPPKFQVGALVQTTSPLNIRTGAGVGSPVTDPANPFQKKGARGVVLDGPTIADGVEWYRVKFPTAPTDGWCSGAFLAPAPPPAPAVTIDIQTNGTVTITRRPTQTGGPTKIEVDKDTVLTLNGQRQ